MGEGPRRRSVRKKNRTREIRGAIKQENIRGVSKRTAAAIAVREAIKKKREFVVLDLPNAKGIYSIRGSAKRKKIRLVQDLNRERIVIKSNPWLRPAANKQIERMPRNFIRHAAKQLRLAGIR